MRNSFPSTHATPHVLLGDLISQSSTNIEPTSLLPHQLRAREAHVVGPRRRAPQLVVAAVHYGGARRLVCRLVVPNVLRNEEVRAKLKSLAYSQERR